MRIPNLISSVLIMAAAWIALVFWVYGERRSSLEDRVDCFSVALFAFCFGLGQLIITTRIADTITLFGLYNVISSLVILRLAYQAFKDRGIRYKKLVTDMPLRAFLFLDTPAEPR